MGRHLFWTFRAAGEWLAVAHPTLPSMMQYLELRHRCIDHALEEIGPDRVVELGAGLSRRGITWAVDRDVDYLEIDLPHMVRAKRAAIAAKAPAELRERCAMRLRHEAFDVLGDDFEDWLAGQLAGAKRPTVIAEGVIGYFEMVDRQRVLRAVARALARAGGGTFLCDLRAREGGRAVAAAARLLRGGIWVVTRGRGAREDFESTEAIQEIFADSGFVEAAPVSVESAVPALSRVRSPARVWRAESAK
jgi:O-methyltransferase involved in polyketide biosynthesis